MALMLASWLGQSQQKPDFSGTWTLDESRSERGAQGETWVITQTATELTLRMIFCCQRSGDQATATFPFNRWGRRGARPGDTKPTQARWDGDSLILHSGPDMDASGGAVRIWRLASGGAELVNETIDRGLGRSFDFKEASIPKYYTRNNHV